MGSGRVRFRTLIALIIKDQRWSFGFFSFFTMKSGQEHPQPRPWNKQEESVKIISISAISGFPLLPLTNHSFTSFRPIVKSGP
jgi:hypothetical protein